jgi:hypothetical protein
MEAEAVEVCWDQRDETAFRRLRTKVPDANDAIMDLDEFLVPISGPSVPGILEKLQGLTGITLNWVVYGTNGQLRKESGPVIERFRYHTVWNHEENRLAKVIADPRQLVSCMIHDHDFGHGLSS